MDWRVPFRRAKPRQPRNPESPGFTAGARSCVAPRRVSLVRACRLDRRATSVIGALLSTTTLGPAPSHPLLALRPRPARREGFTLIEVLIVTAIVAVLAAIALQSYQAQIRKGNRAAAQSYMMDLAQREAQYLLDARAYAPTEATLGYAATPADVAPYYTISIAAPVVSPPAFTITATAIGVQAPDGGLTIDNRGTKTPSGKW